MNFRIIHQGLFWVLILLLYPGHGEAQNKQVVIEGKIGNYKIGQDTTNVIEIFSSVFLNNDFSVNSVINGDGSFHLSFPLFRLQDVTLKYKGNFLKLLAGPGSSVRLEFDSLIGPVIFKGDFADLNREVLNYERAKEAFWKELYGESSLDRFNELSAIRQKSTPEKFKSFIYDRLRVETDFYNNYILKFQVSDQFKHWAKAGLEYEAANNLIQYLIYHEKEKNKIFKSSYFDFFDRFPLDNLEASISSDYIDYLNTYNNSYFLRYYNPSLQMPEISKIMLEVSDSLSKKEILRLEKIVKKKESNFSIPDALFMQKVMTANEDNAVLREKLEEGLFYKVFETYKNKSKGFLKDVLVSDFFYQIIQDGYLAFANKNIKLIEDNVKTDYFRDAIDALLVIKNRKPEDYPLAIFPQDYRLPVSKDDSVFHRIIERYKGKVIYVDFWGTWCGPCREEMPASRTLWQNFQNKDVIFLYLGVESKEETWQKAIATLKIPGEHYLLSNSEYGALKNKFQINGIPHHILIDKAGRIKDANAKTPSDKGIKKEIEEML